MIYITGDTHGKFNELVFRIKQSKISRHDTLIICGDFGFVWNNPRCLHELDKLSDFKITIAFIDGNHEDFRLLNSYPIERWKGGLVHRISRNIVHLMRGQRFVIERKSFFTMGGAFSLDKDLRIPNISWWKEELPDSLDYSTAMKTMRRSLFKFDYILTHTAPKSIIYDLKLAHAPQEAKLSDFLEKIYTCVEFKKWFAGHYHMNRSVHMDFHLLYDDIISI